MHYSNQSILDVTEGIIVHQVNCKGVMGAGLAKQIRSKYPQVFKSYKARIDLLKPGMIQLVQVSQPTEPKLIVCNLAGQDGYGRDRQYTEYEAVRECLIKLQAKAQKLGLSSSIYFPYKMGCGLGGGDWSIIESMIAEYCPDSTICKLES